MKKTIALLMTFVMLLSLCACGSGSDAEEESTVPKATITKSDGTTEVLTQEDLREIFKSNEINYNQNYRGCEVVVDGIINEIEQQKTTTGIDVAVFSLGFPAFEFWITLSDLEEQKIDITSIGKGTKVTVSGILGETFIDTEIEEAYDLKIITAE